MKEPVARPVAISADPSDMPREPRAFDSVRADIDPDPVEPPDAPMPLVPARRVSLLRRFAWGAGAVLVSAALGLAAERLVAELFARTPVLGWLGLGVVAVFVLAVLGLILREILALRRLTRIDGLRRKASLANRDDDADRARRVLSQLDALYAGRSDLDAQRVDIAAATRDMFDGTEQLAYAERRLMAGLDARARTAIAASSRRVALVTAVSPRALVDIGFVLYESIRLVGMLSRLYGGRPGVFGGWRLARSILAHLAVTGGLVLTDGVVEELVGQGIAARLSARLGEGVINALMTVRVGIAAMIVLRPLPFETEPQPTVREFLPELVKLSQKAG